MPHTKPARHEEKAGNSQNSLFKAYVEHKTVRSVFAEKAYCYGARYTVTQTEILLLMEPIHVNSQNWKHLTEIVTSWPDLSKIRWVYVCVCVCVWGGGGSYRYT